MKKFYLNFITLTFALVSLLTPVLGLANDIALSNDKVNVLSETVVRFDPCKLAYSYLYEYCMKQLDPQVNMDSPKEEREEREICKNYADEYIGWYISVNGLTCSGGQYPSNGTN